MSHPSSISHPRPEARTSPFEAHDPGFAAVLGDAPRLVHVAAADAHEGPVYVGDEDALYFTTLPRHRDIPAPGLPGVAIKRVALQGYDFPVDSERISVVRAM